MRRAWAVIVIAGAVLVTACASSATSSDREALLARAVERLVDETVAKPIAVSREWFS